MAEKILCIDDTPKVRLLIRRLLPPHYAVLEAGDGLRGIELAEKIRENQFYGGQLGGSATLLQLWNAALAA